VLERVERQPAIDEDDQLAVDYGALGQLLFGGAGDVGNRSVRLRPLRDQIRALSARTMTPRLVD
jgi:hypothetical protein